MASTLRTLTRLPRHLSRRRAFSTCPRLLQQSPFGSGPAPPRLPKSEQEIFEKLQRQSTGAFSTPRDTATATDADAAPATEPTEKPNLRMHINQSPDSAADGVQVRFENGKQIKKGEDLHPNMRRGAPPEFEGDVNPKTGEVGGPKNEPLRWGGGGDWSYNGRVTDF